MKQNLLCGRKERNYQFRERLLEIHKKSIRNINVLRKDNEFEFKDGLCIYLPVKCSDVVLTAAKDFEDYLFTSMNVSAMLKCSEAPKGGNCLTIKADYGSESELGDAFGYRGFRIDINQNEVSVCGFDDRGIAQALYYLEDIMNIRKAPFVQYGTLKRKPLYSPQMVHSGYGLDEYPSEYLSRIAHEGRDAILLFVKDLNITPYGYLDFNELIYRASKYGIDVYAYSYMISEKHPEDTGAEDHYESTYGRLFRECPGLKGVVLVGESVEFPSRDPHVAKPRTGGQMIDGIPTGKPRPGWYPCKDYPQLLSMLKKVISKYKKDADIVFWTYNWGYEKKEARIKLIDSLPTDISLMATFEMHESYKIGEIYDYCADYTLSFEGYGKYFQSEAEAAKKKGIRLYSMTNTGGLTWDFGVIPYEPFPYQWIKRYNAMKDANEKWGLCGIMESHHYGFYPSVISKLSKWVFNDPKKNPEEILHCVLEGEYGSQSIDKIEQALKLWSEAIAFYVPSNADQYGAFRVGPSYPFCLDRVSNLIAAPYSMFGASICTPVYNTYSDGRLSVVSVRLPYEIDSLKKMKEKMKLGLEVLDDIQSKNEKILELINLGEFILRSVITGINAKQWHLLKTELHYKNGKDSIRKVISDMENLLRNEIRNAEETIALVQADSRLGWEPSMEYMTDEKHLRWKIRQLNYVIDFELNENKKSLDL